MSIITFAALSFDRLDVAEDGKKAIKPLQYGCFVQISKSLSFQNSAYLTVKKHPDYRGFLIAAASAALYSSLESAGCTVKTGWSVSPLTASLVALVERLHNLSAQSGKMVWQWMNQPVMRTWSGNRWSSGQEHFILLPL